MASNAGVIADTEKLLTWLQESAKTSSGRIPAFTNADAMAHLGRADLKTHARHHGNVQSRIDFACFRSDLPPLGLCADQPFEAAWNQQKRSWAYPVDAMMAAAQSRAWSDEDFDSVRAVLSTLPKRASTLWSDQLERAPGSVKAWAESFPRSGVPRVRYSLSKKQLRIDWSTDELILALDLYLHQYRTKAADDRHPKVRQLSTLLNLLAAVLGQRVGNDFRNPNGVAMKLHNFSRLDPMRTDQGKVGLKQGSQRDIEVWNQFAHKPEELQQIANTIKARINDFAGTDIVAGDDDPEMTEAAEGRLLTRTHRVYERQSKLVATCKKQAKKRHGFLFCAACDFNFGSTYGEDADHIIDCHHTKPVHTLGNDGMTHIDDLVLLCSNCHRLVHAFRPWLTVEDLKLRLQGRVLASMKPT